MGLFLILAVGAVLVGCRMASCAPSVEESAAPSFPHAAFPTAKRLAVPSIAAHVMIARATPPRQEMRPETETPPAAEASDNAATADAGQQKLEVEAEGDPDIGRAPLTVHFNVGAPDEADDSACEWSFDDGSPPTHGRAVSHTYAQSGEFMARLTVTLSDGRAATRDVPIQVDESQEVPETE